MPLITLKDLERVTPLFRGKCGNSIASGLMKILSVDKINDLYDRNSRETGPEFASSILKDIGINYEVANREILDKLGDGPFITISNHPYGSIDGIILVDFFGHLHRDYKVIVNKFLSVIKAMGENFINVTPSGNTRTAPTNDSISGIKSAMTHVRDGHPLGIFPSGAVSDLSLRDGCVRDRQWQEPVIRLIRKLNVPVIPVKFQEGNSALYYALGLVSWKVRLLKLPSEVFNKRGRTLHLTLGDIITPERQREIQDIGEFSEYLRKSVYGL